MNPIPQNIMLVDDDKFLLDMYSMKFVKEGFSVQACLSVNQAIEALHGGFIPDAILFDLTMPERDGYSFLTSLREEHLAEHAKKIALTNQSTDAEKAKAMELGADDFIVKATMIPSEVVAKVRSMLGTPSKS
jgi:DNA-binding response OmpR family regulator